MKRTLAEIPSWEMKKDRIDALGNIEILKRALDIGVTYYQESAPDRITRYSVADKIKRCRETIATIEAELIRRGESWHKQ